MAESSASSRPAADVLDIEMMMPLVKEHPEERVVDERLDQVKFVNVRPTYPPGEDITLTYVAGESVATTAHDWVGVYKVGWKSPKSDYYTFVWATSPLGENDERTVTFTPRYLPTDQSFYQFCYVTRQGEIRGISSPFQIKNDFSDDELVCIDEDSDLVMVETRERRAREYTGTRVAELEFAVTTLQEQTEQLKVKLADMCRLRDQSLADKSESEGRMSVMRASIAEYTVEIEALNATKKKAVEDAAQTAAMVTEIEAKLSSVMYELNTTAGQVDEAKAEQQQLLKQCAYQKALGDKFECELESTVEKLHHAETALQSANSALDIEEEENEHLASVNEELKSKVITMTAATVEMKRESQRLEDALVMANERNVTNNLELHERIAEVDHLRSQLAGKESAQTAAVVTQIEAKLGSVVYELNMTTAQMDECKAEQQQLLAQCVSQKEENERLQCELASAVEKHLQAVSDLQSANSALDVEEDANEHLTSTVEKLKRQRTNMETAALKVKAEGQRLEDALSMANDRKVADDLRFQEINQEANQLRSEVASAVESHYSETRNLYQENSTLREKSETFQRLTNDLQGELMAMRITLDQSQDECRRLEGESSTSDLMQSNIMELVGENNLLRSQASSGENELRVLRQQLEESTSALSQERDNTAAMFALQKAYEDARTKCEEAVAANRQQSRLARAAESTVKVLEAEADSLRQLLRSMKAKLQEAGEHYREKYMECTDLTARLESAQSLVHTIAIGEDVDMNEELEDSRMECEDLRRQLAAAKAEKRSVEQENDRLKRVSCDLLQSIPPQRYPPTWGAAAASVDSSEEGDAEGEDEAVADVEELQPRNCPVCLVDLPWSMLIEDVQEHCASHFDS